MSPEDLHHLLADAPDTPTTPAATFSATPEHASLKNSSRTSYGTRRLDTTTPPTIDGVA
jgi:hypothetical protein